MILTEDKLRQIIAEEAQRLNEFREVPTRDSGYIAVIHYDLGAKQFVYKTKRRSSAMTQNTQHLSLAKVFNSADVAQRCVDATVNGDRSGKITSGQIMKVEIRASFID